MMGRRKGLVPRRVPLFISSPSHRPPGAFFFSLPSLPKVQRGLCEGERAYPKRTYLQLHFNYKTKL